MNVKVFSVLLCLFLFSACTSQGSNVGPSSEPVSGSGLLIKFKVDDERLPVLRYDLEIKNMGKYPITLSRENFKIKTFEENNDGSSVFTSESENLFYQRLFKDGSITMGYGQEYISAGSLELEEDYYSNLNKEEFTYILEVDYDYKTDFNSDVSVDKKSLNMDFDISPQAAPVKVTDLEFFIDVGVEEYAIIFTIDNIGDSNTRVKIENPEFYFSSQNLNCYYEEIKNSNNERNELDISNLVLDSTNKEILAYCSVSLNSFTDGEISDTKAGGSFEYNYLLVKEDIVRLPKERSTSFRS